MDRDFTGDFERNLLLDRFVRDLFFDLFVGDLLRDLHRDRLTGDLRLCGDRLLEAIIRGFLGDLDRLFDLLLRLRDLLLCRDLLRDLYPLG